MKPSNVVRVLMACVTLHNFLINEGCGYYDELDNLDDVGWDGESHAEDGDGDGEEEETAAEDYGV